MSKEEPKSITDILSNGTHDLPIEQTMEHLYKHKGNYIKDQMRAINEASKDLKPKGVSKDMMKVASIPEDVYSMLIQKYGRNCLQDPKFLTWFLEKHPHFKYFPSTKIGSHRL